MPIDPKLEEILYRMLGIMAEIRTLLRQLVAQKAQE
jgi:hypothetical protein